MCSMKFRATTPQQDLQGSSAKGRISRKVHLGEVQEVEEVGEVVEMEKVVQRVLAK